MAKNKQAGDYYDTLRAQFAGKKAKRDPAAAPKASFKPPVDPSEHYFGAEPAGEEASAARLFDPAGVMPLREGLARQIDCHGAGETAMLAQAIRLGVGLLWLALAGWFFMNAPVEGASLTKLFAIIGAAGAGAALFGAILINATGKTSMRALDRKAEALGGRIALETQSLGDGLGGRKLNDIEAEAFLQGVSFADNTDKGREGFTAYLKREPGAGRATPARVFLAALAGVAALGLGAGSLSPQVSGLPLAAHPVAFAAVIAGAVLYIAAGFIAAPLRGKSEARAEARAFEGARAAYAAARTETGAPSLSSLSARLRDARGRHLNLTNPSLDERREYESVQPQNPAPNLDWRTRDSGPRFVETGFHAAPKTFRTDAFEKKFRD